MTGTKATSDLGTHLVENQPEPRGDIDLWAGDLPLREAVARAGAGAWDPRLADFGARAGSAGMRALGRAANRIPPELAAFDRAGRRIDEVSFHPAYHALMAFGIGAGYSALPWTAAPGSGAHVAHAAMVYMLTQVEPGVCCPMTMTYAAVPALAGGPALAAEWGPRLLAGVYDPASCPAGEKRGATIGMAMTEKQGGSDLRGTTTRAVAVADGWRLTGHKWFCSAPMSDAFLTLAQAPGGLSCFLVPRWTPEGGRNGIRLMRLKDKLGNRANASAEIEYAGARAAMLGEEGAGVRTILSMVHHTRLDTAMAPAGLMRAALDEALWWCRARRAFGRRLVDQPLMAAVLADIALEVEAALAAGMRVALAFDRGAAGDAREDAFARLAVALAKFQNNKRCPVVVVEAMECMGGGGYVEEGPVALWYREAPLNAIWEGSGNVICMDVLRTLQRVPDARAALRDELRAATVADRRYDAALAGAEARWPGMPDEAEARWFVERHAALWQASLLIRQGNAAVADAFVATRLAEAGRALGAVPTGADAGAILARVAP